MIGINRDTTGYYGVPNNITVVSQVGFAHDLNQAHNNDLSDACHDWELVYFF